MNGALEPWLNSEDDISTFDQVYQLINTLIETANSVVVGDYTAYPRTSPYFLGDTIMIKDHRKMVDVRAIEVRVEVLIIFLNASHNEFLLTRELEILVFGTISTGRLTV